MCFACMCREHSFLKELIIELHLALLLMPRRGECIFIEDSDNNYIPALYVHKEKNRMIRVRLSGGKKTSKTYAFAHHVAHASSNSPSLS